MKILHVLDVSLPHRQSGYSIRSKYIVETQKELGFELVVFTRYGGQADEVELINGISYWRHATEDIWRDMYTRLGGFHLPDTPHVCHVGARLRFGKRLAHVIEAEAPDVIHVASPERNAIVAIDVGHQYGLPVVYEVRGLWHESSVAQGLLDADSEAFQEQQALHVRAMKQADVVVTLSDVLKAECVMEGIDEAKVFVVPNGVSAERCVSVERSDMLARELGIADGDVVLGYVGLVRSLEGLDILLYACERLRVHFPQVKVMIVGGGRDLERLRAEAEALGLADAVICTGEVPHDDVDRYYALIDVVVIPRIRSRVTELVTPLKPYEAMAKGKALVVSDVAALREVVDEGKTGLVCRADDVDDLSRVCKVLIGDTEVRQKLGERGREWVQCERTWQAVVGRYEAVYRSATAVLGENKRVIAKSSGKKRIAFYSQHLVGVGHHFRNRQIVGELSKAHDVFFIDGGREVVGADLPKRVARMALPPLCAGSGGLVAEDSDSDLDAVLHKRRVLLKEAMMQIKPHVFCIEFFPFCRWSLRAEIVGACDRGDGGR